jgi:hypothetical protein
MVKVLEAADYEGVFQYQTPSGGWLPSTLYTWKDMIEGVKIMATQGVGKQKLFVGEGSNYKYGLVNLAAFLGESMKETIMYNACDENNWSDPKYVQKVGGQPYTSSYACGRAGSPTRITSVRRRMTPRPEARWLATLTQTWNYVPIRRPSGMVLRQRCSAHPNQKYQRLHYGIMEALGAPKRADMATRNLSRQMSI